MEGSSHYSRPAKDGAAVLTPSFADANNRKTQYYLYCIWDRISDSYYVGISRSPESRIAQNLVTKKGLKESYQRTRLEDTEVPMQERNVQHWVIGRPWPAVSNGYSNILIGCISEGLHMLHLEEVEGKTLFNENYFGGHADLKERRPAFNAVVKILKPSLSGWPMEEEMRGLKNYIHEIRQFITDTQGRELLNKGVFEKIHQAYTEYQHHQARIFGEDPVRTIASFKGHPLLLAGQHMRCPQNDDDVLGGLSEVTQFPDAEYKIWSG